MATVATWITRNGHKVYLRKGGAKNVHNDFYRVEGKGVSGMHGTPLHLLDKKHALEVAKANVRTKDNHYSLKHDNEKYGHKEVHRMATIWTQHAKKNVYLDQHEMIGALTRSGIPMKRAIAVVEHANVNAGTGRLDFTRGWYQH